MGPEDGSVTARAGRRDQRSGGLARNPGPAPINVSQRRALGVIIVIAAALRITLLVAAIAEPSRLVEVDSQGYLELAQSLDAYGASDGPLVPLTVLRPPGYPTVLAALLALAAGNLWGAMLLQSVLSIGTVLATFLLGRELAGNRAGLVGAGFVAVESATVVHSVVVLSETVFTLIVILGAFAIARLWREPNSGWALFAGLSMAVATLTRPLALFLPIIAVLASAAGGRRHRVQAAVLLIAFVVPVGGWVARNAVVADAPTVSSIDATNLYYYRAGGALSAARGEPFDPTLSEMSARLDRVLPPSPTIAEVRNTQRDLAVEIILDHPVGMARTVGYGMVAMAAGPGDATFVSVTGTESSLARGTFVAVSLVTLALLELGALVGLVDGVLSRRSGLLVICVGFGGVLLLLSAGAEAYSRFRVPWVPFAAVLAGVGYIAIRSRWGGGVRQEAP